MRTSAIPIPTGLADLTPAWLSAALAGPAPGAPDTASPPGVAARVVDARVEPIGTGQIADSARVTLTWDPPAAGPPTVVAKVTAASEASRQAGLFSRTYEVEVGFYLQIAPDLEARVPRCHWAGFDGGAAAYAVLLEDVAPAVQGDQVAGCTPDDADAALAELARLHAPRWGDRSLRDVDWLARDGGRDRGGDLGPVLATMLPGFLDRYGDRMSPEVVALTERFVPRLDRYGTDGSAPETIIHGDYRIDNLMFGLDRVVVLDWQTVGVGAALSDASYLLGGSLVPAARREVEEGLVRGYWERLVAGGVGCSWEACWEDHRRYAFAGLIMAVFASMVVQRTPRGDEMFVAMAERAGLHALDLESESLLR
ncbi:MAG: phosphotransferase [Actinobacteria bacterium]|nr:phosphotransferase [Actinomycetota bacterium]